MQKRYIQIVIIILNRNLHIFYQIRVVWILILQRKRINKSMYIIENRNICQRLEINKYVCCTYMQDLCVCR